MDLYSVVTETYADLPSLEPTTYEIVATGLTSWAALDLVDRIESDYDDAAEGEEVPMCISFVCPDGLAAAKYGRAM